MAIVLDGTSGATLPVPLAVAQGGTGSTTLTLTSPVIAGTPTGVGVLTSGTVVASTSGTSIDFTGIPSWVKRITILFNGVSTNGGSNIQVQIGNGSVITSGYNGASTLLSSGVGTINITTGFILYHSAQAASTIISGRMILTLLSANTWIGSGIVGEVGVARSILTGANSPILSSALDRVRITTVNGTDLFDAGSINILYE